MEACFNFIILYCLLKSDPQLLSYFAGISKVWQIRELMSTALVICYHCKESNAFDLLFAGLK